MQSRKRKLSEGEKERLKSSISMNIQAQDPRTYQAREKKRLTIGRESFIVLVLAIGTLVLFLLSVVGVLDLTYRGFSLAWLFENVRLRTESLIQLMSGDHVESGIAFFIVQFVSAILCGAGLSASAAIYQGTFHNPLASPTLLGVQSGGTLGQTVFSLYVAVPAGITIQKYSDIQEMLEAESVFQLYMGQLFVLAGCFLAVFIVVAVSRAIGGDKLDTVAMLLAGTVLSSVIGIVVTAMRYTSSYMNGSVASTASSSVMMATFSTIYSPRVLALMGIPMTACMILACLLSGRINMIVFGEEEARTMGMNVKRQRNVLIVISTVLTSFVIAFCGQIAFIGLVAAVPARRIVGPDYRYLMPASIFMGGLMMIVAYDLNYMVGFAYDTGSMVSLIGGVFFLVIMTVNRRKRNADWA